MEAARFRSFHSRHVALYFCPCRRAAQKSVLNHCSTLSFAGSLPSTVHVSERVPRLYVARVLRQSKGFRSRVSRLRDDDDAPVSFRNYAPRMTCPAWKHLSPRISNCEVLVSVEKPGQEDRRKIFVGRIPRFFHLFSSVISLTIAFIT